MRRSVSVLVAAAMALTGSAATLAPAQAMMATISPAVLSEAVPSTAIQEVDHRGEWRRYRNWDRDWDNDRRWRRGDDWDERRWRRNHRDDDDLGAAAAAGIIGLAAGALIAGSLSGSQWDAHVRACAARYRSYDPYTDTFLGYDGRRHRCTAF